MKTKNLMITLLGLSIVLFIIYNWQYQSNGGLLRLLHKTKYYGEQEKIDKNFKIPVDKNASLTTSFSRKTTKTLYPGGVILLTQCRSGSSFVGEIFNQRSGVAYFYEPLFPFGKCPRKERFGVADYFRRALRFDFSSARKLYYTAFKFSNANKDVDCTGRGICFVTCEKCSKFLSRDTDVCRGPGGQHQCPPQLDFAKIHQAVRNSTLIAFKSVYLCDIEWIEPVLDDPELNLKIVHLVRDPRATLNSRANGSGHNTSDPVVVTRLASTLCAHLNTLVNYSNHHLLDLDQYMRIRHEDFALEPIKSTNKVYKFVNITMNDHVQSWLEKATSSKNSVDLSKKNAYSTIRNSAETVMHWRKELPFEAVRIVQNLCKFSLERLGYRMLYSEKELQNLNLATF